MAKFVPKRGQSTRLNSLALEDGQFIITSDDGKIYTDLYVNGTLTRVPVGGTGGGGGGLDFSALSDALTGGTLTNITIVPDAQTQTFDIAVIEPSVEIDSNGYWVINGVTTSNYSKGDNGITPSIDSISKHWMIGSTDTNIVAEGQNGTNGITPSIDSNSKHWIIGSTDTNVIAEGQNGITPSIDPDTKHWIIGSTDTGIVAEGQTGSAGITPSIDSTSKHWMIGSIDTGVVAEGQDGITTVATTKVDLTCTALASGWSNTVPYTQTVSVSGITSTLNPLIDVVISNTVETGLEEEQQFSYITKATTDTNSITFYCYKTKPTIDLNIIIEVV